MVAIATLRELCHKQYSQTQRVLVVRQCILLELSSTMVALILMSEQTFRTHNSDYNRLPLSSSLPHLTNKAVRHVLHLSSIIRPAVGYNLYQPDN